MKGQLGSTEFSAPVFARSEHALSEQARRGQTATEEQQDGVLFGEQEGRILPKRTWEKTRSTCSRHYNGSWLSNCAPSDCKTTGANYSPRTRAVSAADRTKAETDGIGTERRIQSEPVLQKAG